MRLKEPPWVVKLGGRLCEDASSRAGLATACAALAAPLVVVHGGGAQVSSMQVALGFTPTFFEGRRVTLPEAMQVVEMVLSGSTNKALVRALLGAGRQAAGMSGIDGALVRADLVPELGRVGVPSCVQPALVTLLLENGITPVLSPVSAGPDGAPVNVNADEFACAVAQALGAARLLLLSDVAGVQVSGAAQAALSEADVEPLIARQEVTGGMVPKLRAAAQAVRAGVGEVRIAGFSADLAAVTGTMVVARATAARG